VDCQPADLTAPSCRFQNDPTIIPPPPCYGNANSVFDVYARLPDLAAHPLPSEITRCDIGNPAPTLHQIVNPPMTTQQPNLHLDNIRIRTSPFTVRWLSPICKPAIYLYPEEKTAVNVQVAPQGNMTLTIPDYPKTGGWNVIAYPDGNINYQNSTYDYLYYEAEIPDSLIEKPQEGFVVAYDDRKKLLNDLLPKLGLNQKESTQFKEYWLKALPKSPYYFVGIMAQENLNTIAPLTIQPKPDTTIRVTLYFEALEQSKEVKTPTIGRVNRDGFILVEWGGIVKTDPTHPFSCFM
jgi:hypothetical protein